VDGDDAVRGRRHGEDDDVVHAGAAVSGGAESPFDDAFLASLPRLEVAAGRLSAREGPAGRAAPRRGGRVEFAEHRAYVPGDDLRHIDWHAFARSGRLHVKEFERREEFSVLVVVDDSASMALHGKLVVAQRLAYAIAYFALAGGHRVRAALAGDGALRVSGEVAGRARVRDVGSFLLGARGAGATRLTESLRRVAQEAHGGRLVVLLSDLWADEDGRTALATCARRGDEVRVFHLVASADVAVPPEAVAEDVETGERRVLGPDAADAAVREAARRADDWGAFAARHGFLHVPLDAARPTEELLLRTLRDAGVLR
jgi:uncharacterized protein (DUF58 family)